MKLKFIFSLLEYLGQSTEFWGDFSKILFFPPLVDIYRHPLLIIFSNSSHCDVMMTSQKPLSAILNAPFWTSWTDGRCCRKPVKCIAKPSANTVCRTYITRTLITLIPRKLELLHFSFPPRVRVTGILLFLAFYKSLRLRRKAPSKICIILHIIRKQSSFRFVTRAGVNYRKDRFLLIE